jgi:hypothetical protein
MDLVECHMFEGLERATRYQRRGCAVRLPRVGASAEHIESAVAAVEDAVEGNESGNVTNTSTTKGAPGVTPSGQPSPVVYLSWLCHAVPFHEVGANRDQT